MNVLKANPLSPWRRLLKWIHHHVREPAIDRLFVLERSHATPKNAELMTACERLFRDAGGGGDALLIEPRSDFNARADVLAALIATLSGFAPIEPVINDPAIFFDAYVSSAQLRSTSGWRRVRLLTDASAGAQVPLPSWSLAPSRGRPASERALFKELTRARWPNASTGERLLMAHLLTPDNASELDAEERAWMREVAEAALQHISNASSSAAAATTPLPASSTNHLATIIFEVDLAIAALPQIDQSPKTQAILMRNLGDQRAAEVFAHALLKTHGKRAIRIARVLAQQPRSSSAVGRVFAACLDRRGPVRTIAAEWLSRCDEAVARDALWPKLSLHEDVLVWSRVAEMLATRNSSSAGTSAPEQQHNATSLEDVPQILKSAPWRIPLEDRKDDCPVSRVLRQLSLPPFEERAHLEGVERGLFADYRRSASPITDDELCNRFMKSGWQIESPLAPAAIKLLVDRGDPRDPIGEAVHKLHLRFHGPLALAIESPRIAEIVALRLLAAPRAHDAPCADSIRWLIRYPVAAVLGLLAGLEHLHVDLALRLIQRAGHDVVAIVREHHGVHIAAIVEHALAHDPPDRFTDANARAAAPSPQPNRPIVRPAGDPLGAWPAPLDDLPRPRLRLTGKALSDDAYRAFVEMLSVVNPRFPSASVAAVRAACTRESLYEFAWGLACLYERERETQMAFDYRTRPWLLHSIAMLFGAPFGVEAEADADELIARISPRMHGAPIVDLLAMMPTTASARELVRMCTRHPVWLSRRIKRAIELVAAQRNESMIDLLETATLTDAGAKPEEAAATTPTTTRMSLDYGPRRVMIQLDPATTTFTPIRHKLSLDPNDPHPPRVADETGTLIEHPPAAKPGDDPVKVARAFAAFTALIHERTHFHRHYMHVLNHQLGKQTTPPLEGANWSFEELRARYIDQPELGGIIRGLLFVRCGEDPNTDAFRVAEDGSLANIDDESTPPPADDSVRVRLVGENEMTPDAKGRWQTLFFDYAIVPTISQL